jgi:hypothetical protein
MPSKKSGGKRAVEKKHDERAARRRRGGFSEKAWLARYAKMGPAPAKEADKFVWAAELGSLAIEEAAADPGPPPEQRREQIIRGLAQLAKILPAAEIAADLRRFKAAVDAAKKPKPHGAQITPRAPG